MSTIQAAVDAVKAKEAELNKLLQDAVTPVLDAIAETGVPFIYVFGSTPGFNDGEPCEHDTTVITSLDEIFYDYEMQDRSIFADLIDEDAIAEHLEGMDNMAYVSYDSPDRPAYNASKEIFQEAIAEELGLPWKSKLPDGVYSAIESIIVPSLDREFHTDYEVLYRLVDGKYVRTDDEYDCGY